MKTAFRHSTGPFEVELDRQEDQFTLRRMERTFSGKITSWKPPFFILHKGEQEIAGAFYRGKNFIDIHLPEGNFRLKYEETGREGQATHAPGELTSPMPGKILKVLVAAGDAVEAGQTLMILEAMKMEHKILSPLAGTVHKVLFKEGDRVSQDVELVKIES